MAISVVADIERFRQSVKITDSGCWLWQKAVTHDGYGQIGVGSRKDHSFRLAYVHVWAFEVLKGPVPEGLELDHLCRNRRCANPDHLEPVTHQENVARGRSANRSKFSCIAGHALEGDNLYVTPTGKRMCKECRRRRSREYGRRTGWAAAKAYRERQ